MSGATAARKVLRGAARSVPRMYDRVSQMCTSALGLIAALAWHSAFQEILDRTTLPHHSKLYYAFAVTGLAGISTLLLTEGGTFLRYVEHGAETALGATKPVVGESGSPSTDRSPLYTVGSRAPLHRLSLHAQAVRLES